MKYLIIFIIFVSGSLTAKEWHRSYLTSYPRSGNHWVRYLVEEATNTATGSVYCDSDPQHMKKIFPWGGYCMRRGYEGNRNYPTMDQTVLIKTHYPAFALRELDQLHAEKVIRLVRHPVDAFYSLYIYGLQEGETPQSLIPTPKVKEFIQSFQRFQDYWNGKKKVLTIRYEDLYTHPHENLRLILQKLDYPFSEADINRAVAKYPPKGGLLKNMHHYTKSQLDQIKQQLAPYLQQFHYNF